MKTHKELLIDDLKEISKMIEEHVKKTKHESEQEIHINRRLLQLYYLLKGR
ncbi:MAG: hypothetical protein PHW73_04135 [Atribacterota bacterium]|nr:hypothetical protein [Atribacterota bacterium]